MKIDGTLDRAQLEPRTSDHATALEGAIWNRTDLGVIKAVLGGIVQVIGLPAGIVVPYGGSSVPDGWLACDGSAVSRTTYAGLFAALGTTYGVGDGSTTFNLPDTLGRTVIGSGAGSGLTSRSAGTKVGAETHTLSAAESGLPAHTHIQDAHSHVEKAYDAGAVGPAGGITGFTPSTGYSEYATSNSTATTVATNQANVAAAASSAHNNMQPSIVIKMIIKT